MPQLVVPVIEAKYQQAVERGITQFTDVLRREIRSEHPYVQAGVDAYLSVLMAGGKRVRGVLTLYGYELYGGTDTKMISFVAGIIEAIHAYLLVVDDVADHAYLRRGKPAAHIVIQRFLKARGGTESTPQVAEDVAISGALYAQHKAQELLTGLDIDPAVCLQVIRTINDHLAMTGRGQMLDISTGAGLPLTEEDITNIARAKTAYYSFYMPLEVGALLAGSTEDSRRQLVAYAQHAGLAYQLHDDIIGLFGDEATIGKSVKSDIVEGKQTLLIRYALDVATEQQVAVIQRALGNGHLTDAEFTACRDAIKATGALKKVGDYTKREVEFALQALEGTSSSWPDTVVEGLRRLVTSLLASEIISR
jgi:geranylgeranyl pyrophosphate synthase